MKKYSSEQIYKRLRLVQLICANSCEPSVRRWSAISSPHCSETTFSTQSTAPGGLQPTASWRCQLKRSCDAEVCRVSAKLRYTDTTNLPHRNARAQHLNMSRCWDVANFCPLVVLYNMSVAGVRVVEFGTNAIGLYTSGWACQCVTCVLLDNDLRVCRQRFRSTCRRAVLCEINWRNKLTSESIVLLRAVIVRFVGWRSRTFFRSIFRTNIRLRWNL